LNILIGTDPEVFLIDPHGTIVSAIGHVGGTKTAPIPVACGALQEDNVLAEFNIEPARTSREFISNITTVMHQLRTKVAPLDLHICASHRFTKQELIRSGRQALMFGCDPDFNAYTGEQNNAPSPLTELRTAGGHVHVGYDAGSVEKNREIIRTMDITLGIPSVVMDSDTQRRAQYGAAGAYRNKPYGVEYRSLSNFWLNHADLMEWVFNRAKDAVTNAIHYNPEEIIRIINTSDVGGAKKLIRELNLEMP